MQSIKIIPHGHLRQLYQSFEIVADTAADALEGWARQVGLSEVPFEKRPIVNVVDFEDEAKLRAPTTVTELHLVPAMFGGGGVARILIGGVMIVAGVLLTPVIGPVNAGALISAGIGMVIGGVMSLFMKSPKVEKTEEPEASKYIGTGENSTQIGTPIGFGGGRMRIGGHFLSVQVNSSEMVHGTYPATPT